MDEEIKKLKDMWEKGATGGWNLYTGDNTLDISVVKFESGWSIFRYFYVWDHWQVSADVQNKSLEEVMEFIALNFRVNP